MANVNYINPGSLQPDTQYKPDGFLGGLMYSNNMNDYRKVMDVQHYLQSLGAQRAGMEHQEYVDNAPLRDVTRGNQLAGQRAMTPFIPQLVGANARAEIAKDDFHTQTTYSPKNIEEFFRKIKEQVGLDKFKNLVKSHQAEWNIANTAEQIKGDKTQGVPVALDYVRQEIERYKEAGIPISDSLLKPEMWPNIRQAGIETSKVLGDIMRDENKQEYINERTRDTNASRERQVATTAGARIGAANISANAPPKRTAVDPLDKPPTKGNEESHLRARIARDIRNGKEPDPSDLANYNTAVESSWTEHVNKGPLGLVELTATRGTGKKADEAKAKLKAAKEEYFRGKGINLNAGGSTPQPKAQPGAAKGGDGWGIVKLQ